MELNETFNKAVEASRALNLTDVSRIDADLVCSAFHGRDSQTVIKMNICHQRNVDLAFDRLQAFCRFHGRHRHPDDVTARLLQL